MLWVRVRCCAALIVTAVSLTCSSPAAHSAGLLIADGGLGGLLEIEEHTATVTINNGIAVTEVEQHFRNTENRQVEALYVFPVPRGASVANFSMWIDGREMVGEVVEKQRAREIYESYKQTNTDPGLLEQKDYKTFEMRIFPIAAGAVQRVRISYYQQLDYDSDWATYVYPLSTSAHKRAPQLTTGKFGLTLRVLSQVPIADMGSPSHHADFVIVRHSENFYEASCETNEGELSRDVVLSYQTRRPRTGLDLVASKPRVESSGGFFGSSTKEDGYFMLTLTAGDELAEHNEPADYVFVLDVSGSMAFGQKLSMSRNSIAAFVETLSPEDRFDLMTFNMQPQTLFGELQPASAESLDKARQFLDSQQARGGTVLRHAMQTAYRYGEPDRQLNVVVLSDGMTEQQERAELLQLIHDRPANATVFTIGVGNEVNRPLLEQLAEDAGGLAAFLSEQDDFARQAESFRRKLTRPAAANVRIKVDGVTAYDVAPAIVPNLYHGSPVRIFGRYRGSGPFHVSLDGEVRGKPYSQQVKLDPGDGDNPEIERMWAQQTIASLLKDADRNDARSQVIDRIVDLGETYSIVTDYSSFIVLENDAEYQRWKIDRKNAKRLDRDRAKREQLDKRLERLREESLARVGPKTESEAAQQVSHSTVSETPEPSTLLLLLLGAGPLLLARGRR